MKSLKPRLLTAFIGIPALILFLFVANLWNPIMGITVALATAFMVGEYLNANKLLKNYPVAFPCIAVSFLIPLLINTSAVYAIVFLFMVAVAVVMMAKHENINFMQIAYAVTGTLLITFGMSAISKISIGTGLIFYFSTIFSLPWMADAGAFFVGATVGKHKLCHKISPKKTVEGAVGGVIFCLISAVLVGLIFQFIIMKEFSFNFVALIILSIIVAPLSIVGDLTFSLIKRSLGIKDYGSIFPGHGGMLDRFDSIIFTAPVMVILNQFMPFFQ